MRADELQAAWLGKLQCVGPEATSPEEPRRRPPSWSFGRSPQRAKEKEQSPGPGYYEQAALGPKGPKFTFGARRRTRMHPLTPMLKMRRENLQKSLVYAA